MTTIASNLYKALKEAGVKEELAEKASHEVAESTRLVLEQDTKIDALHNDMRVVFEKQNAKINILITLNVAMISGFILMLCGFVFTLLTK